MYDPHFEIASQLETPKVAVSNDQTNSDFGPATSAQIIQTAF